MWVAVMGSFNVLAALVDSSEIVDPESSNARTTIFLPVGPSNMTWLVMVRLDLMVGGSLDAIELVDAIGCGDD